MARSLIIWSTKFPGKIATILLGPLAAVPNGKKKGPVFELIHATYEVPLALAINGG